MKGVLLAGAGGFLGAALRYTTGVLVVRALGNPHFPWATLAVNVAGCFLIGMAAGASETRWIQAAEGRTFLVVGILGGFTTFSSFGYETVELTRNGQPVLALANVTAQILLGLAAVAAGWGLSRQI